MKKIIIAAIVSVIAITAIFFFINQKQIESKKDFTGPKGTPFVNGPKEPPPTK